VQFVISFVWCRVCLHFAVACSLDLEEHFALGRLFVFACVFVSVTKEVLCCCPANSNSTFDGCFSRCMCVCDCMVVAPEKKWCSF
jgi:hypothetical protein